MGTFMETAEILLFSPDMVVLNGEKIPAQSSVASIFFLQSCAGSFRRTVAVVMHAFHLDKLSY